MSHARFNRQAETRQRFRAGRRRHVGTLSPRACSCDRIFPRPS